MGQITTETIAMIRRAVDAGQAPPLTLWEYTQLAFLAEKQITAAQPSPEPSKPEQAEAPGDSDPLTPEQEEWVMDLAEKHNLGRRVSQIGTMRGVAPDVFYTDASYRTGELFSFAAELLSTKEQS